MNEHTYWNSKGEEQAKYDEMQAADFPYTQASKSLFHSYYRYYNDGDLPGWARTRWDITKYTFDYGYRQRVLTAAGEEEFERRVTERIQIEEEHSMCKNAYWNSNGPEQAKYDEMEAAGFKYTKATETVFHSYYRYYNDGDLPGWARSRWDVTRYTFKYGYRQRVLTEAGEAEFEKRITERIQIEYRRFLKAQRNPA